MSACNLTDFIKQHKVFGYLHFLAFPLDIFITENKVAACAREQRVNELTPIVIWLIPLIVLLSNTTVLNFVGLFVLYFIEALILTIISALYCWRGNIGFLTELFLNYAIAFIALSLLLFMITMLFSSCGIIFIIVLFVIIFSSISNNFKGNEYYNDDW